MKRKVGLYLESRPSGGGTFQYNQIMIDAVASLPVERYSVVIGYESELWLEYLKDFESKQVLVPRGFWGRALGLGWTLLGLPMGLWRRLCPLFHPMARVLLRERCDLWIFPAHDLRSYQFPVPSLVSIHDLMFRYEKRFPESASGWEYLNRERSCRAICQWSKGVLVDSETGRKQLEESYGMPPERIHVLPYIAPRYMHAAQVSPGFDERYRLPAKFIFYPAQFWEHKNHRKLITAVSTLKDTLPDLKLVLSGARQNACDSVAELVRELDLTDDVVFLGYVPDADMPDLYRRARALVMPTYYGPTNIPPLEAFVSGCPVAISGIYGMPEQVGDAALLFDPDSIEEIAACIRKLWTDDRLCADLAEKGTRKSEAWGQQQFNDRFRVILETVIGAGNP
jgi:glycosyltransferase involved in cell wall biosynthesis